MPASSRRGASLQRIVGRSRVCTRNLSGISAEMREHEAKNKQTNDVGMCLLRMHDSRYVHVTMHVHGAPAYICAHVVTVVYAYAKLV